MSSFFSLGGRRRPQVADPSDYDNRHHPGGGGGDDDQHHHQVSIPVPPREISFSWFDTRPGYAPPEGFATHQQEQQQQQLDLYNHTSRSTRRRSMDCSDDDGSSRRRMMMMMSGGLSTGGRGSGGGICCQDCGNQSKKDCSHQRCRTCCRSRGFDCPTHVKSTWVPAPTRRERQQQRPVELSPQARAKQHRGDALATAAAGTSHGLAHPQNSGPGEMDNFPAELNSPAMFRCVRVTSSDDGEDQEQYAYQTAVNIGGHVFKGILYDQGPEHNTTEVAPGESSSGGGSGGVTQPLSLGAGAGAVESAGTGADPTAPLFDPYSSMYHPPFNTYNMAGTSQFFPHPR